MISGLIRNDGWNISALDTITIWNPCGSHTHCVHVGHRLCKLYYVIIIIFLLFSSRFAPKSPTVFTKIMSCRVERERWDATRVKNRFVVVVVNSDEIGRARSTRWSRDVVALCLVKSLSLRIVCYSFRWTRCTARSVDRFRTSLTRVLRRYLQYFIPIAPCGIT